VLQLNTPDPIQELSSAALQSLVFAAGLPLLMVYIALAALVPQPRREAEIIEFQAFEKARARRHEREMTRKVTS
jgi:hypothetical protein